jgi:hypothetical protein
VFCLLSPHLCWATKCANDTRTYAEQLLKLHSGIDRKVQIESRVKALGTIGSPRSRSKREREEVWGRIDGTRYRMRFTYLKSVEECVLVGQEIFEFADNSGDSRIGQ